MLNLSIIQGRFSADPELKKTPAGNSVIAFTLACQREKKGEDGVYPTDWIPCAAWNGTAEFIARNFKKKYYLCSRKQEKGLRKMVP